MAYHRPPLYVIQQLSDAALIALMNSFNVWGAVDGGPGIVSRGEAVYIIFCLLAKNVKGTGIVIRAGAFLQSFKLDENEAKRIASMLEECPYYIL